ncbi:MAG: TetR/AcrR family transcriptional regulator [Candidatus Marinimicrobia bacterium]|nr:TetR/AcrR family transcriptional regulator [FCB group bacterium]MBL7024661.1 TetR/AcrR family transcriptional regulator [Candidatus Neomarinimicrobiota bacterium]
MIASEKREQRKEQHRLEILQTAEQIFARQGYHTTTMETVAEECGWSKGTLYLYFKNKEDLFFSILLEKMDRFSATLLADLKSSKDIEGKIFALIDAQFRFFTENKHYFQLLITEQGKVMHTSNSGLREELIQKQHSQIDQISQALEKGMKDDTPVQAIILAGSIIGSVNLHLVSWLMAAEAIDLEYVKSQLTTLFINGISTNEKI